MPNAECAASRNPPFDKLRANGLVVARAAREVLAR